jgi:hypothetical protein
MDRDESIFYKNQFGRSEVEVASTSGPVAYIEYTDQSVARVNPAVANTDLIYGAGWRGAISRMTIRSSVVSRILDSIQTVAVIAGLLSLMRWNERHDRLHLFIGAGLLAVVSKVKSARGD